MVGRVANPQAIENGCDFGYALAANSCEGVICVDASTVTALGSITAFAVSEPRPSCRSPRWPGITQRTSNRLFLVASPFLPSTRVILIQQFQLSTPKVGANAVYFHVPIFSSKS